jgi:hypothetical protein
MSEETKSRSSFLGKFIKTVAILIIGFFAISLFLGGSSPLEKEVQWYEDNRYTIDESENWEDFQDLDGEFTKISKDELRDEAELVMDELGYCRIFVDRSDEIIWVSGIGSDPQERYIYYWEAE